MADLKPCPFCGGGFRVNYRGAHEHDNENCFLHGKELKNAKDVKAWNTRKPMEAVVAELEVEKERHEKDRTYWSEHSWKDSLMYNECDMSDRKADCFDTAISIVRGKE